MIKLTPDEKQFLKLLQDKYGSLRNKFIPWGLKKDFVADSRKLEDMLPGIDVDKLGDYMEQEMNTYIAVHPGDSKVPSKGPLADKGLKELQPPKRELGVPKKRDQKDMVKVLKKAQNINKEERMIIKNPFAVAKAIHEKSIGMKKPRKLRQPKVLKAPASKEECDKENKHFIKGSEKRRAHCRNRRMPRLEKA